MVEVLSKLSDDLAAAVEKASPGIVRVEGRRRGAASGVVWSPEGIVVTSHHVLEQDEQIGVGLPDGRTVPAALVGRDPTTDLAVLRAETSGLEASHWADSATLKVGHLVLALGRPGRSVRATIGIVSAHGGTWHTPAGGEVDRYLQTDVVMYPGFSGGPLVDTEGQVLGINSSAILRGMSVTVPDVTVRRVVETLLAHGRMRRGYMGVGSQPVRLPEKLALETQQDTGLLLVSVEPDGPAQKHGLLLGDLLIAIDGHPVRYVDDLLALLGSERIGKSAKVSLVRGGKTQEILVVIGERS